jgi:hypothetical protein
MMRLQRPLCGVVLGMGAIFAAVTPAFAAGPPPAAANRLAATACLLAAAGVPLGGHAIVSDVDFDGVAVLTLAGGVTVTVTYVDLNGNHLFTCGEPITSVTFSPPSSFLPTRWAAAPAGSE